MDRIEIGRTPWWIAAMALSACGLAEVATADGVAEKEGGSAVFLFEYEVREGLGTQFEDGYRRHLEWHESAGDPLDWFGWTVFSGARAGRFVDAAFHLSFRDFDERVDPAADRRDFARNVAPFVEPAGRRVYRWRPELGTAEVLGGDPAPMAEVTFVEVPAARRADFERALAELGASAGSEVPRFACYELLSGGERPSYMLYTPRRSWSEYDRSASGTAASGLDVLFATSAGRIQTETWIYRANLTYRPAQAHRTPEVSDPS